MTTKSKQPSSPTTNAFLGEVVDLPNRPKELPTIYRAKGIHPLWTGKGQAYVYLQDLSPSAMAKALKYEKGQKIPTGTNQYVQDVLGESFALSLTRKIY